MTIFKTITYVRKVLKISNLKIKCIDPFLIDNSESTCIKFTSYLSVLELLKFKIMYNFRLNY